MRSMAANSSSFQLVRCFDGGIDKKREALAGVQPSPGGCPWLPAGGNSSPFITASARSRSARDCRPAAGYFWHLGHAGRGSVDTSKAAATAFRQCSGSGRAR